jgi:hypothetical protein
MEQQEQPIEQSQLQDGEVQATEQEQQMIEKFYLVSEEIIHSEGKAGDQIADMVLKAQDVSVGIGNAASTVLIATEKKAGKIPDDMKIQLSMEIIATLSELAVNAGALSEDEIDDGFIDATASNMYSSYLSAKEAMGELDPQELEQSVVEAEQLMGTSVRNQQGKQPQPPKETQGGLLSMGGQNV